MINELLSQWPKKKKVTEGLHIGYLLLSRNSSSAHDFKCLFL